MWTSIKDIVLHKHNVLFCSFHILKHGQCNGNKDSGEIVELEEYLQTTNWF